ncbi:hypothetical protein [Ancylobacter sp. TS-1]|uniref:hypothetical protein n=1 Tax=Ancylobacter sp. TS-1 TaxID=1850374 RepID=UPI001265BD10|nr:hypothetical protein [Ancylobacter sp. TS-1]QFR32384.1 hypothetical protein GBB76_04225 [Ancylobacter sp. TS-1]
MIAPRTLAQRIEEARVAELVSAVVATLKPLYPGVDVRDLPGRIDIADIIAGDVFAPPMIGVTFGRVRQPILVGGSYDLPVDMLAYIVVEETAIGARSVPRETVAHAIGAGLFEILADLDAPRWGLNKIRLPEDAEMRPLVTAKAYAQGVAYYAMSWRQVLLGMGTDPLARPQSVSFETVLDGVVVPVPDDLSEEPV